MMANRHAVTVRFIVEAETREDAKHHVRGALETWQEIAFDYDESGRDILFAEFVTPRAEEPIIDNRVPEFA